MTQLPAALGALDEATLRRYEADPSLSTTDWQLVVAELAQRGAVSHVSGRQFAPPTVTAPVPASTPQREPQKRPAQMVIVGIKLPFGEVLDLVVQFTLASLIVAIGLGMAGGMVILLLAAFGAVLHH